MSPPPLPPLPDRRRLIFSSFYQATDLTHRRSTPQGGRERYQLLNFKLQLMLLEIRGEYWQIWMASLSSNSLFSSLLPLQRFQHSHPSQFQLQRRKEENRGEPFSSFFSSFFANVVLAGLGRIGTHVWYVPCTAIRGSMWKEKRETQKGNENLFFVFAGN